MILPVFYLFIRASDAGFAKALTTVTEPRTLQLLGRTVTLTLAVTLTSVIIAVPLAWLTARTDLPWRSFWTITSALPLVIPSYVAGFAFVSALGPRGQVQRWLEPLGVERLPEIYGFFGAWLVLTLFTYPYVLLTVRAAIRGLDPALEEAAIILDGRRRALFKAVGPQLRPAVASGALLVALYTFHDFGAVSLLRFDAFTNAIYLQYRGSFDRSVAAILSLMLIVVTTTVVLAEVMSRGRASYHRLNAAGGRRVTRQTALGVWKWPAFAACSLLATMTLVVPLGFIGYWLYREAMSDDPLIPALMTVVRSFEASAAGTVMCVLAAIPVALLIARHPGRLSRAVETSSFVGHALPGVVVALALVFFGARYAPVLYQTRWMLAFAYTVLFMPLAVGSLRASMLQVSPQVEEAARTLGRSGLGTWRAVTFPLVRPGLIAAAALVFLSIMKELPATLMLAPTGYSTLATRVWGATNEVLYGPAAVHATALVLLASIPLGILLVKDRRIQ
ncbi:MAG: iron ABC transporter permease [Actinomycetota bacterium]